MVLSQHEGGECLDDVVHIAKDKALRLVTNHKYQPHKPSALGLDAGKTTKVLKPCERQ
ncbi:hypothetical protein BSPWISOXPB_5564 [uncultured Gammaproteobacteria bacterium]|nr:hypothetical protein BSPWISOXPB_5564 [uncultured Gammaproteobacteria bacterium]